MRTLRCFWFWVSSCFFFFLLEVFFLLPPLRLPCALGLLECELIFFFDSLLASAILALRAMLDAIYPSVAAVSLSLSPSLSPTSTLLCWHERSL